MKELAAIRVSKAISMDDVTSVSFAMIMTCVLIVMKKVSPVPDIQWIIQCNAS